MSDWYVTSPWILILVLVAGLAAGAWLCASHGCSGLAKVLKFKLETKPESSH
jgi:F0F1-type ATP synthase assembly protein I